MKNLNTTNKFPNSLKKLASRKILFRLINIKLANTLSREIFEEAKFSTNVKDLFTFTNSRYRKQDFTFDTKENKKFVNLRLIVENKNDTKEFKEEIKTIIEENKNYLNDKDNKILNRKSIEENIKFFEEKISTL
tara:strand:+ start:224 stop:625 length:402 start_codon:yes stop_codon:yes gene_type:complete